MKFLILSTAIWIGTLTFGYAQEDIYDTTESATRALKKETERLSEVESLIAKIENLHYDLQEMFDGGEIIRGNVEEYLQHPLNQLHLMRRYADEWRSIEKKMRDIEKTRELILSLMSIYNIDNSITGGIDFLQRLDDVYQLDAANFSRGIIPGVPDSSGTLSADECIKIGVDAYSKGRYSQCAKWMKEAYSRMQGGERSSYHIEGIKRDFLTCKSMHELPDPIDYQQYKKLCRQDDSNRPKQNNLKCFLKYDTMDPWTRFIPVKVEPISVKPDITVYHDLIGRGETEHWKEETTKVLLTTSVVGADSSTQSIKHRNLSGDGEEMNKTLRQLGLVEDLERRNIDTLKISHNKRQVSTTFSRSTSPFVAADNDFNLLIFLSTVEQGGAIVFRHPPLSVAPSIGTVVTWQKGVTVAECPVLYGDKWTATLKAKPMIQNFNLVREDRHRVRWSLFDDYDTDDDYYDEDFDGDDRIYISPFLNF